MSDHPQPASALSGQGRSSRGLPAQAVEQHADFLRGLARALVGDEHLAEDVVQSTWLATLPGPPFGTRDPRAWLAAVARNLALKLNRSEGRRGRREREAARPEELPPPGEGLERVQLMQQVTDAVAALEEPYRTTVLARFYEGLAPSAIAARERVPVATVKSRLQRALARLRERLDRDHGGDRGAWCLGLVSLLGAERLGLVGAGVTAATSLTTGALIVTSKLKLAAAGLLALVGLTALWMGAAAWFGGERVDVAAAEPAPVLVAPTDELPQAALATVARASAAAGVEPGAEERAEIAALGSLRVEVFWSDGAPAAGVVVKAHPWGATDPFLASSYARADARGEVLFEDLAPGRVGVYADRGGFASTDVEASLEASASLTLRKGLEVSGRVVSLRGIPVPDAEIWLSDTGNGTRGVAVATSDASGRFVLRDVSDQNGVCAHKAGFAPSPSFWIQGSPGDSRELELVLQGTGAALAVRVVDHEGEPVEGARVHVVEQDFRREGYEPGVRAQRPIPYLLATDSEGGCTAPSLLPGEADVVVGATGLAPWTGTVTLVAGAAQVLDVALTAGVTLHGAVRSTDGDPLEGVSVRVGGHSDLDGRQTRSGADGGYRLVGVAPGEIAVRASLRGAGRAAATLQAAEGAELEWNPVIDPGLVLRGRLVDEHGDGLAGWMVNVGSGGHGWDGPSSFSGQTFSDDEGRFRVVNCPDEPLWLQAIESRLDVVFPEVELEDLRAGPEEHRIEVADLQRASARIEGRVLGPDGRPISVEMILKRADRKRGHTLWSEVETGSFRIGPLAPGTYALSAAGRDGESLHREGLELVAGAALDLGTLFLDGPGGVEIVVAEVEGVDRSRVHLTLMTLDRGHIRSLPASELSAAIELPAGRYLLEAFGSIVREQVEFGVAAGETTVVELTPRAGVRVALNFQLPADLELPLELELVFRPDDGGEAWQTQAYLAHQDGVPAEYSTYATRLLPPASGYTLEVSGPGGLTGSVRLGADLLRPGAHERVPPTEVVLR